MTSATTLSISCAILAAIAALALIVVQIRQYTKRNTPDKTEPPGPAGDGKVAAELPKTPLVSTAPTPSKPPLSPQGVKAGIPVTPPPAATAPQSREVVSPTDLTSKEIIARIKGLSGPQADAEKKKYLGLRVDWPLYFSNLMLKSHGKVEVTLLNENNDYPMVSFLVDVVQHPEVNKIKQGMQVTVKGEIEQVFTFYIVLKNVEFTFTPAAGG